jgi:ABC-type multidrug transport system fused ATPase/permease subunit
VNLHIPSGATVGILGATGSSKSTLVQLIPRLYDVSEGTLKVGGIDVRKYDLEVLRDNVAMVLQKNVLFSGTIKENLRWGNENATDEELWAALNIAQASEVVKDKAGELDAEVLQGGSNFSGGQRQRLTIARALVRKPAILILDDSASALDYATDAALRMAIRNMQNAPTTFIVSQRAASVRFADLILVLDDGCLVGKGTHEELLESCEVYQEIYYSQFPGEVKHHG